MPTVKRAARAIFCEVGIQRWNNLESGRAMTRIRVEDGRGTKEVGGEGECKSDVLGYVELVFCWTFEFYGWCAVGEGYVSDVSEGRTECGCPCLAYGETYE
jgi:hypothetical protein